MKKPVGRHASYFTRFASLAAKATGHPMAFVAATILIILWSCSRPLFKDFDTWQLVINTATTIITFLMVFLIQSSQNRDTHALQIKLDELIHSSERANNALLDIEELDERDLEELRLHYQGMAGKALSEMRDRRAGKTVDPAALVGEAADRIGCGPLSVSPDEPDAL